MSEIAFRPAVELARAILRKQISSRELLDLYLDRVQRLNPQINAIVTLDVENARRRADTADAALARGDILGHLHGVPVTVKDNLEVAGVRSTAGSETLADHVPQRDALVVERLKRAGGIVFGKTNLSRFGSDPQTFNALFGTTHNPWQLDRSPGGSSGGSAAALAAGLTGFEVGSDIGGSLRAPAHYCGVYAHKPSFELVPRNGHLGKPGVRSRSDMSVLGPMGRSVDDLALGLDLLAHPDPAEEGIAIRLELPPPRWERLSEFRVATWTEAEGFPLDQSVATCLQSAVQTLRKAGTRVSEARPEIDHAESHRTYMALVGAAFSTGVPEDQYQMALALATELPDDGSYQAMLGRAITQRHRDWLDISDRRHALRRAWARFFQDYDVLLTPVTCIPAFPHTQDPDIFARRITVNGEERPYLEQIFWAGLVSATYLPATAIPVGVTPDGLPVGMQIIGPYLEDRTPLHFARRVTDVLGGFTPPPGW